MSLGRLSKRYVVRDFIDLHNADIVCIQESKLGANWIATISPQQRGPQG